MTGQETHQRARSQREAHRSRSVTMARPRKHRARSPIALAGALLALIVIAVPAHAQSPIQEDVDRNETAVLTGVCPFAVHVSFTQSGTDTLFFDKAGGLKRIHGHIVEQDVFSANGNVLVGLPYTFNVRVLFDPESGMVTNVYGSGVVSRVPLPGGGIFLTAGRLDFIAGGTSFLVQPDVGAQGDIAGFCEALS